MPRLIVVSLDGMQHKCRSRLISERKRLRFADARPQNIMQLPIIATRLEYLKEINYLTL